MSLQQYQQEIERIEEIRLEALEALGERALQEFVKPACDRYGLDFVSGMGRYFFASKDFSTSKGMSIDNTDIVPKRFPLIKRAFEILNIPVDQMTAIGNYVPDYQGFKMKAKQNVVHLNSQLIELSH